MQFVSSFRPFDKDPDGCYRENQMRAFKTWMQVAERIVYFNAPEPELESSKTVFIPTGPYPHLLELIEYCAMQETWCAILNADICVPSNFVIAEAKLKARKAKCASSWRFNFDPAVGFTSGVHDDNGLDFFAAVPEVWQRAYELVDERLYLGATGWDQWALSLFCTFYQGGFYDLTPSRLVFHPNAAAHGERKYGPCTNMDLIQTYAWPSMTGAPLK